MLDRHLGAISNMREHACADLEHDLAAKRAKLEKKGKLADAYFDAAPADLVGAAMDPGSHTAAINGCALWNAGRADSTRNFRVPQYGFTSGAFGVDEPGCAAPLGGFHTPQQLPGACGADCCCFHLVEVEESLRVDGVVVVEFANNVHIREVEHGFDTGAVGGAGVTEHGNVRGPVQDHDGGEPVRPYQM